MMMGHSRDWLPLIDNQMVTI